MASASITQTELAQRAGVSRQMVQRALTNHPYVDPKKRVEIKMLAKRLGYRPNAAAQAMRKGRFNAIGLLTSTRVSEATMNSLALWAIEQEMAKREMHLVMSPIPDEKLLREGAIPHILRQWSVDGLLVSYTFNAPQPLQRMLTRHRVPAIWLNTRLASDCVYLDDIEAGRQCARRLLDAGHRRIGYVSFRPRDNHYSAQDRHAGCIGEVHAAGLTPIEVDHTTLARAGGDELAAIMQWLSQPDRPTAVTTYEEGEASVVLMAAARMGLDVPRDLSVCSVRSSSIRMMGIAVSGMEHRHYRMGERGVEQLMKQMESPGQPLDPVAIQPTIVEGSTIASPSQA